MNDSSGRGTPSYLSGVHTLNAPLPGGETDIDSILDKIDPAPKVVQPQPVSFSPELELEPIKPVRRPSSKLPPIHSDSSTDLEKSSVHSIASAGHIAPVLRPIKVDVAPAPGSDIDDTDRGSSSSQNSRSKLVDMAKQNDGYNIEREDTIEMKMHRRPPSGGGDKHTRDQLVYSPPDMEEDFSHLRRWDSTEDITVSLHQASSIHFLPLFFYPLLFVCLFFEDLYLDFTIIFLLYIDTHKNLKF